MLFLPGSLLTGVEASAAQNSSVTKTCLQCGAILPSSARACSFCDSSLPASHDAPVSRASVERVHRSATACLYTRADFVKANPNTCQALANAVVRGLKWLQTAGPSDIIKTGGDALGNYSSTTLPAVAGIPICFNIPALLVVAAVTVLLIYGIRESARGPGTDRARQRRGRRRQVTPSR